MLSYIKWDVWNWQINDERSVYVTNFRSRFAINPTTKAT